MRGDEEPVNRGAEPKGLKPLLLDGAASLFPGYFALVMASGIISVGLQLEGLTWLSRALLVVCAGTHALQVVLTVWRFLAFRPAIAADFARLTAESRP